MNEKTITIITLAALGVVLIAGGGGIYYIQFKLIKDRKAEAGKTSGEVKTAKDKAAKLEKKFVDKKDPEGAAFDVMMSDGKTTVSSCRLQIPSVRFRGDAGEQDYDVTAIQAIEIGAETDTIVLQEKNVRLKGKLLTSEFPAKRGTENLKLDRTNVKSITQVLYNPLELLHREKTRKMGLLSARIPMFRGPHRKEEADVDLENDILFVQIEKVRRQSNVGISSSKFVPPKRLAGAAAARAPKIPANIHKVQYEFIVGGGFYQLLRFINLIETSDRSINVDFFTMTAGKPGSGKETGAIFHALKITLHSFSYRSATGPAKPAPKKDEKKDPKKEEKPVETPSDEVP